MLSLCAKFKVRNSCGGGKAGLAQPQLTDRIVRQRIETVRD
jgi:hypothetical protein